MATKAARTKMARVTRKDLERLQSQHPGLQTQLEEYRESRRAYDEAYGGGKTAVHVGFQQPSKAGKQQRG